MRELPLEHSDAERTRSAIADQTATVSEVASPGVRLLFSNFCVRTWFVPGCVSLAQQLGSELGGGALTPSFSSLDEPLLSGCTQRTRVVEYLRCVC